MKKAIIFTLAIVCIALTALQAQEKKKVAVYVTGSGEAGVNKVLGGKMVAAITQSGTYTAIERTAEFLAEINKEQGYQRTGNVDDSQISRLGKQFGVNLVCVAEVYQVLGSNYVSARLIDVESATVLATADGHNELKSIDDLFTTSEDIAARLLGGASARGSSSSGGRVIPAQGGLPEMVQVQGGTFMMGCTGEQGGDCYDNERPAHYVSVNSFKLSKTEITNAQYAAFLNGRQINASGLYHGQKLIDIASSYLLLEYTDGKWRAKWGFENYPIVAVTWHGAYEYCNWAGGRLPTEAEWEYAARGGNKSSGYKYSGSNIIEEVAWFTDNSGGRVHEVATKKPNELGLYDMSGNVWEWCYDWYGSYSSGSQNNPVGAPSGSSRVNRGGSWNYNARYCRVSYRSSNAPAGSNRDLGFRLLLP